MFLVEICWMHAQYPLKNPLKLLEDINGCASANMIKSYDIIIFSLFSNYFIILYDT